MRAACIVMVYPRVQEVVQVMFGQRDHEIEAFPPQRADEPLAEGIRLGTPRRCFEDLQPQVVYMPVKRLGVV